MNKILVVFAAAVIACHAVPTTKQGEFNRYFVYTNANPRLPIEIIPGEITEESVSALFSSSNTTIIVHGHRGSVMTSLNPTVKDAFLRNQDINVIVVDWSTFASQTYSVAAGAVPSVGASLASVITALVGAKAIALNTLHLVGFDLGAHVVGFAGRNLDGKVARITGLSPAAQNWGSNSQRINKNDALYVEIIHTDAVGILGHGIGDPVGDVDFFVNGGTGQPGCFLNNYCSHNRAWEVFAATLTNNHLIGNQCGNWLQVTLNTCRGYSIAMGNNDFNKLGSGMFRVNTRRAYPF
ncbi:pancreatic lipase-related protein 2-like [Vanessa cardui]|uniref:pancreatic lipase-related protein 2-like n=1 Tax=Vanessa cardui TaxID=171605 RepID=UPI001F138E4C|nr:pancreatic lipase-related protein 2-like [Vanessa cardui]